MGRKSQIGTGRVNPTPAVSPVGPQNRPLQALSPAEAPVVLPPPPEPVADPLALVPLVTLPALQRLVEFVLDPWSVATVRRAGNEIVASDGRTLDPVCAAVADGVRIRVVIEALP